MRLELPHTFRFEIPLRRAMPLPRGDQVAVLALFTLAFQPFGSMPALLMLGAAMALLILTTPLAARVMINWLVLSSYLGIVAFFISTRSYVNPPLFLIYFLYWTALVASFHALSRRMGSWDLDDLRNLVNWLLAIDLALNLVPVLIELKFFGLGDYVTGMSGLFISSSLSQNRTNSLRAGCIAVLALANFQSRKNIVSAASFGFNMLVLLVAVSVTSILAFIIALAASVLLRRVSVKSLVAILFLAPLLVIANILNQALGSSDIFDLILNLNTHFVPKIDFYRLYFMEMAAEYPWMPWVGQGLGNNMNRFALLTNFPGFSNFPGRDAFAAVLQSPFVQRYVVDYYHLDRGIAGNSIISVPWSSLAGVMVEIGALGAAFAGILAWPALKALWQAGSGSLIGSGRFLIIFVAGNLFWDCYFDYPEVMLPFFICALALVGLERGARRNRRPSAV